MTSQVAITLDEEQRQRLEAVADARHETVADVAARAIAESLSEDAAFRKAVEEGLLAGRAGDASDFAPYADDLRRRMAVRAAETDA
jgi:predicted transcriptional regulator